MLTYPLRGSVAILCRLKGHAEVGDFTDEVGSHQNVPCCQVTMHELKMETT